MAGEDDGAYEVASIVIDPGCGVFKSGFSTESEPRLVFQSVVGRVKVGPDGSPEDTTPGSDDEYSGGGGADGEDDEAKGDGKLLFGDDVAADRDSLLLSHPLQGGRIKNWDDFEGMLSYSYDSLGVEACEYNTFVTCPHHATSSEQEQLTSLLFEKYDVPGMFLHPSSVLSLYSVGHTTGVVVDCGASATRIVPVYEGYGIDMSVQTLPIGGTRLADHFVRMLTERGYYMTTSAQQDMAREMEEQLCYVAKDFDTLSADTKSHEEKTFTLPDGTKYTIGNERFRLPEAMFQPDLMGVESEGVAEAVRKCIQSCDIDLRVPFFKRIVASGGCSTYDGFCARLQRDIEGKESYGASVKVSQPAHPTTATWEGASILCGLSTFDNMWVSSAEFQEYGPSIILRKCSQ